MLRFMNTRRVFFSMVFGLLMAFVAPRKAGAEPTAAATAAFDAYVSTVETRLTRQHSAGDGFLAPEDEAGLRRGELVIEQLTPAKGELPGALLHHWRGTAFAPGARAADFERLLRDFKDYPQRFAPQVLDAKVVTGDGDRMLAWMRVRQKHVLTVVMDTTYDVSFGRLDARDGYSASRSTKIFEMNGDRALTAKEEHGFLWRQNSYWTYEERDGGLYIQIESVSLSRSIPAGLGWAVKPFVESVPRESLEFTLRSACVAIRK
jgi:hypothetical protein